MSSQDARNVASSRRVLTQKQDRTLKSFVRQVFDHTDSSTDVQRRVLEHNNGVVKGYTYTRRSVKVVFVHEVANLDQAFALERQIKGWSRVKKEALIAGDFDLLRELARNRE